MIRINNLQKNFGTKKAVDIENYTIGQGDMLGTGRQQRCRQDHPLPAYS